jgi:hypothetical protein
LSQLGAARVAPEKLVRTSLPRRPHADAPCGEGMSHSHIRIYDSRFFRCWEAFADILKETYDRPAGDAEEVTLVRQLRFSIVIGALGQLLEDLKERELASEFHSLSHAFMDIAEGVVDPLFASQMKEKKEGEQTTLRSSGFFEHRSSSVFVFLELANSLRMRMPLTRSRKNTKRG